MLQRRRCCAFFDSSAMKCFIVSVPSQKKLNTYGVESPCKRLPRVDYAFACQPWAIKNTTRTELPHESIYIAKFIHLNNGATPAALHRCNIRHGG